MVVCSLSDEEKSSSAGIEWKIMQSLFRSAGAQTNKTKRGNPKQGHPRQSTLLCVWVSSFWFSSFHSGAVFLRICVVLISTVAGQIEIRADHLNCNWCTHKNLGRAPSDNFYWRHLARTNVPISMSRNSGDAPRISECTVYMSYMPNAQWPTIRLVIWWLIRDVKVSNKNYIFLWWLFEHWHDDKVCANSCATMTKLRFYTNNVAVWVRPNTRCVSNCAFASDPICFFSFRPSPPSFVEMKFHRQLILQEPDNFVVIMQIPNGIWTLNARWRNSSTLWMKRTWIIWLLCYGAYCERTQHRVFITEIWHSPGETFTIYIGPEVVIQFAGAHTICTTYTFRRIGGGAVWSGGCVSERNNYENHSTVVFRYLPSANITYTPYWMACSMCVMHCPQPES